MENIETFTVRAFLSIQIQICHHELSPFLIPINLLSLILKKLQHRNPSSHISFRSHPLFRTPPYSPRLEGRRLVLLRTSREHQRQPPSPSCWLARPPLRQGGVEIQVTLFSFFFFNCWYFALFLKYIYFVEFNAILFCPGKLLSMVC